MENFILVCSVADIGLGRILYLFEEQVLYLGLFDSRTYNGENNIMNNAAFWYRFDSSQIKWDLTSITINFVSELPHNF